MKVHSGKRQFYRQQRGQSTVEFMLMVPVLFAILFFVIEMGLYFTTIHYGNYAAYATARAQQVGFGTKLKNIDDVSGAILNGAVWKDVSVTSVAGGTGVRVNLTGFEQKIPFPFIKSLLPDLTLTTTVRLGPDERDFEFVEGRPATQYDNNI